MQDVASGTGQEHVLKIAKCGGTIPARASGTYASGSEVVRAGLRALKERDAAVEKWLENQVVETYDAMQADPSRSISADSVFATIRARHADLVKKKHREISAVDLPETDAIPKVFPDRSRQGLRLDAQHVSGAK